MDLALYMLTEEEKQALVNNLVKDIAWDQDELVNDNMEDSHDETDLI